MDESTEQPCAANSPIAMIKHQTRFIKSSTPFHSEYRGSLGSTSHCSKYCFWGTCFPLIQYTSQINLPASSQRLSRPAGNPSIMDISMDIWPLSCQTLAVPHPCSM